jgi:hypothetical protein
MGALLDVDGDGVVSFSYDALLISAYLAKYSGDVTISDMANYLDTFINSPTATRNGTQVENYLRTVLFPYLDIDLSGNLPTYTRDGLLLSAYIFFRPITSPSEFATMSKYLTSPYRNRDIISTISYLDSLYATVI